MNLGIAELWSLHLDDARHDLEEGLAVARRIGRPYLEIGCLGHLALAAVVEWLAHARRTAAERGGSDDRQGPRMGDRYASSRRPWRLVQSTLTWLGRFDEAQGWLDQVERAKPPDAELEPEPILHHATRVPAAWTEAGTGRR